MSVPYAKVCTVCGAEFEARRMWAKYCSNHCRIMACKLRANPDYAPKAKRSYLSDQQVDDHAVSAVLALGPDAQLSLAQKVLDALQERTEKGDDGDEEGLDEGRSPNRGPRIESADG